MRLLLIEDDAKVASFLDKGLSENGYAVEVRQDGRSGLHAFETNPFDLVIVDWMLPEMDGVAVCKAIRERSSRVPILFLTVKDAVADKVTGFDAGADDYVTKPFSFLELLVRIRALLRRGDTAVETFQVDDLEMNISERTVYRGGEAIDLSNREFSILEYFLRNKNRLITRAVLTDHVWNIDFDRGSNVVDVYINYLRKKLDCGSRRPLIHTVRGAGYTLKDPER
ncbi:MAG: response regulator transcription factor [bacterium]|nr:response regulator transcription factor [bacterium]